MEDIFKDSPLYPLLNSIAWDWDESKRCFRAQCPFPIGYKVERRLINLSANYEDYTGPRLYNYSIVNKNGVNIYTTDNADYMEYQLERLKEGRPPSF